MCVALGSSTPTTVLVATTFLALGVIGVHAPSLVSASAGSFVAGAVFVLALTQVMPAYRLGERTILVLLVTFCAAGYWLVSRMEARNVPSRLLLLPSLVVSTVFWPLRNLSAAQSLARLSGDYAEDNGAWLLALARSTSNGGTVLSQASGSSGGPGTGWALAATRSLSRMFGATSINGAAENAVVLLRSYFVLGVLSILTLSVAVCELAVRRNGSTRWFTPVVATGVALPFVLSLTKVGHFSASVAVTAMSAAVVWAALAPATQWHQRISRFMAILALAAAGQSWYPLTGTAALFTVLFGINAGRRWLADPHRFQKPLRLAGVTVAAVLVSGFLVRRVFGTYFGNISDLDYLLENLRLVGGYAPVNSLLFFGSVIAVLVLVSTVWGDRPQMVLLTVSLVVPLLVLLSISYAMRPNTPQYGVLKYMFVLASIFVPLVAGTATDLLSRVLDARSAALAGGALFGMVMVYSPPASDLKWLSQPGTNKNLWAEGVVKGLQGGHTVVCLNTAEDDTGRDYEAYLCTRMASSLGGVDTYETRTWTAANICQIPIEQARDAFKPEFVSKLVVVVFDKGRLTSAAGCQTGDPKTPGGWTSVIDWSAVNVVGPDGASVNVAALKAVGGQ